jgi:hypothetical protein
MRKSHAYSHTDADAYTDSNRHGFINTYSNFDTNSDGYPCSDGDGYCNTHSNAKSHTNSESYSRTQAAPDAAATAVTCIE